MNVWSALVVGLLPVACASAAAPASRSTTARELVMAYDDGRVSGTMAFPNASYEAMVRFQLPDGDHRPLRLRFQAEAAGRLEITI
jgi:hypothetical protein